MPDRSAPSRSARMLGRAARWRPGSYRQVWLIVLALVAAVGVEAIAVPAKRGGLTCAVIAFAGAGVWASRLRDRVQRERREALASQVCALSGDDIPGDVVALAAAGMKIQVVKRYRELTGVNLRDAKEVIDSL